LRVYYEDTDFAGIVYYANYLKYIERARSEFVRQRGVDQADMKAHGVVFVVRRVEADYMIAATYGDELEVRTVWLAPTGVRVVAKQEIYRGDQLIFTALVTVVCMTLDGRPTRIPADIRPAFTG